MKILKTAVGAADGNEIWTIDTIEYDGKLWLVPGWIEAPTEGWIKPTRIIRIDQFPHQRLSKPFGPHDIILNKPVPNTVLDGEATEVKGQRFEVVETPDIRIDIPKGIH